MNGQAAGETQVANLVVNLRETLDVGADHGTPVSNQYTSPNDFTGVIRSVTVEINVTKRSNSMLKRHVMAVSAIMFASPVLATPSTQTRHC